jgi:hypothetical protein
MIMLSVSRGALNRDSRVTVRRVIGGRLRQYAKNPAEVALRRVSVNRKRYALFAMISSATLRGTGS